MKYLNWNEKTITDLSNENINSLYENGYLFTRLGKGIMQQTRSARIDLNSFELSSENRRILKKTEEIILSHISLPVSEYDFKIGKMAKDFYDTKFGPGIMSAQKIKEMLADGQKSNFNLLLRYESKSALGFTICFKNDQLMHYSYPFYSLKDSSKDMGMGMMLKAILFAKESGLKYIYLGSLQRPGDKYKLQFNGLEWFDGSVWQKDPEQVKKILSSDKID